MSTDVLLPRQAYRRGIPKVKAARFVLTRKSVKAGDSSERKAEALTVHPIDAPDRRRGKRPRQLREEMAKTLITGRWDRDVFSSEIGSFPLLPYRAVNDAGFARPSRTRPVKTSGADFRIVQLNPWIESPFVSELNVRGRSRVEAVPYTEQPLEGAQKLATHFFEPNPPYGGNIVSSFINPYSKKKR